MKILGCIVAVLSTAFAVAVLAAELSAASYLGLRVPPYPPGHQELGGTMINPGAAVEYALARTRYGKKEIWWLEKLIARDAKGLPHWEIVATMEVPKIPKGYRFIDGACQKKDWHGLYLIAAAKHESKEELTTIHAAWLVNLQNQSFQPIPTAGVTCWNDVLESESAMTSEGATTAIRQRVKVQGNACPDPQRPCVDVHKFKPNELSFEMMERFDFDRGEDHSRPFYAIILKSAERCGISEEERLKVQALFPQRKVFAHRYFCQEFSDSVTYAGVDRKQGFIAVYAGETVAAAKAFLSRVEKAGEFPGANIRKMQVVITWQLE